jgi:glucose/arabinose dehydrogenase
LVAPIGTPEAIIDKISEGERPDLKDKITIPDLLIQAHSASMGMTIYDGDQFPSE